MVVAFDSLAQELSRRMRTIPDFPKPGIQFRDISPILENPRLFDRTIRALAQHVQASGANYIAVLESRGFILGSPVAHLLGLPLVMVRKPGKLPGDVIEVSYDLEYGSGKLQMQRNAIPQGAKVAVIDDLLATGGTAYGANRLVEMSGAKVAVVACIVELQQLKGREQVAGIPVKVLVVE